MSNRFIDKSTTGLLNKLTHYFSHARLASSWQTYILGIFFLVALFLIHHIAAHIAWLDAKPTLRRVGEVVIAVAAAITLVLVARQRAVEQWSRSSVSDELSASTISEPVLDLHPQPTLSMRQRLALLDLRDALGLWRLWVTLGWFDIRLRYRGSLLGPFWLTISTAVMVGALGFLYSALFATNLHDYLPFLSLSLVLWGFVSAVISEACTCFTQSEGMIRSMRLPFCLHAGRLIVRNVVVLAHNIVIIVVVFAIFDTWPGWDVFGMLPSLIIWTVDSLAACLLFGAFCARFRDVPPIVASVMQIAFFVSPIMWEPKMVGHNARFLPLNPFYSLLEIVRGPLLGQMPSTAVWISAVGYSVIFCALAWLLFVRVRNRVAFWV